MITDDYWGKVKEASRTRIYRRALSAWSELEYSKTRSTRAPGFIGRSQKLSEPLSQDTVDARDGDGVPSY